MVAGEDQVVCRAGEQDVAPVGAYYRRHRVTAAARRRPLGRVENRDQIGRLREGRRSDSSGNHQYHRHPPSLQATPPSLPRPLA